jgi:WD40 repeat protein/predicted Ser/Thr protein kinase
MATDPNSTIPPDRQPGSPPAFVGGGAGDTDQSPYGTMAQSPEDQYRAAAVSSSFGVAVPGYEIEGELGRGGMGVVYRAKQTGLNRPVALKMVLSGAYSDVATKTRFLLEAESVAALEHPNIVKVYAFGEHDGHPYLAMEFLPGGNLADRVKKSGPLPAREATALIAKLASAVAHAHTRGIVHRDIKPANVLLTDEGDPRLTDFGLAKVGRSDLSVTGQVLGTPAYMAPEQASGRVHEVGTLSDVYALGAVLYDLLTGRPPFAGDSAAATIHMVLVSEPERLRKHEPGIPRDLETICLKCLEKEPNKRYPSAQAVADDLNRFLNNEPITARPSTATEKTIKWVKRNKGLSAGLAVAALALSAGTVAAYVFGFWALDEAERATRNANRERAAREQAAISERRAIESLGEARRQRLAADRHQAELEFGRAVTSCEEGRVPAGLAGFVRVVELAEANAVAEEPAASTAKAFDRELARVARLNLATWSRELPPDIRAVRNGNQPWAAAFFPDGKRFVSVAGGYQLIKTDVATGQALLAYKLPRTLTIPGGMVTAWTVGVSPDGKVIAAAGADGQIVVWDADSPTPRVAFDGVSPQARKNDGRNIFSLEFAPDGTLWAVDGDNGIQHWDLEAEPKPKLLARLVPEHLKNVAGPVLNVLALAPDGKRGFSGDRAGNVWEWNLESGTLVRTLGAHGWVQDLAVSPDGSRVAATGPHGYARIFDVKGNRGWVDIDLFGSNGNGIAFSATDPVLITADNDGNIRFWHTETGQPVGNPVRLPSDPVRLRVARGTGRFLVPAGDAVYLGSAPRPPKLVLAGQGGRVRGLDFSPQGDRLASADDFSGYVFDTRTLDMVQPPTRAELIVRTLRYDAGPARSQVIRGFNGSFDRFHVAPAGPPETRPVLSMGGIKRIGYSSDARFMYLLGDTLVAKFDAATLDLLVPEKPVKDMPRGAGFTTLSVRPDGGELLATFGRRVLFLSPESLKVTRPGWEAGEDVRDAAYSRDGRGVLIGRRDGAAELLDALTGKPLVRPMPHARAVAAVAVSPDGKFFATGSRDNTARFWDPATGLPVGPPLRHRTEVIHTVFEPNGSRLATGTGGGHVMLWDAPPPPLMEPLLELKARFGLKE